MHTKVLVVKLSLRAFVACKKGETLRSEDKILIDFGIS
jgi:hypothetical protein